MNPKPSKTCLKCCLRKLAKLPEKSCADCAVLNVDKFARVRANAAKPMPPMLDAMLSPTSCSIFSGGSIFNAKVTAGGVL